LTYATDEWSGGGGGHRRPVADPGFSFTGPANPAPAAPESPAPATNAYEAGWTNIRNEALARMRKLSHNHGTLAIEPPRGRVPGPHALAFLYAYHAPHSQPDRPAYQVAAATRLVDDSDDTRPRHNVRDLTAFLDSLIEVAHDRIADGSFDPRISMADRADEMPRWAEFVGIAVSSLGRPGEDWGRQRTGSTIGMNLPARWVIRLIDGTWIEVNRPVGEVQVQIYSTAPLGSAHYWHRMPADYRPPQGSPEDALDRLTQLIDGSAAAGSRSQQRPPARGGALR
jgi:hypothetical protein